MQKFKLGLKTAFTLAEVLITLGVIGVVSAMTIPTLIQNHRKSVVATKLKHASSILQQAYNMSKVDYGDENREFFDTPDDPDKSLEFFEKYYTPYIQFLKVEKTQKGVMGYLKNGSIIYFRQISLNSRFILVCLTHNACKNMNEDLTIGELVNGKDIFSFYLDGSVPYSIFTSKPSHDTLITQCKNQTNHEACLALIFEAGWKIPDDYPIKF